LRRRITTLGRLYWTLKRLPPAPRRSPKRVRPVLQQRLERGVQQESPLEDFVFESIRKFGLPLPLSQHVVERGGRRYRLDLCYLDPPLAVEVDGFEHHRDRPQFDADRLRGNDVSLAGFTLLRFTSAFSDWRIAATIAEALGLPIPAKPSEEVPFSSWIRVWSDRAA
jgi:hypothetical protein